MSWDQVFWQSFGSMIQFIAPNSRIYVFYLLTALVLAFVAYWQVESAHRKEAAQEGEDYPERISFLAYVFDPKVWLHPSSLQDMKYFFANSILYYGLITQFLIGGHTISHAAYQWLVSGFGVPETAIITGAAGLFIYTIVSVLALDFGVWFMHYMFHKIPVLWHFHKVHHSAEQLNPMTLFRMHPVDLFLTSLSVMVFQAFAFAGMFYLTASKPEVFTVLGLNVITFAFYVFGYNLRHSHIWLNYPVWLSRILISPAQHQIHHSSDPKHFDRNMGLIFSFWDQMFGTHYIPREREQLSYGLSRDDPNPFRSVADIYVKPFVWAWEGLKGSIDTGKKKGVAVASLFAAVMLGFFAYTHQNVSANSAEPGVPGVNLEDLTWTEVHTALRNGYTSVIIPTGGTEQNGPFVMLGKHNVIVAHTSAEIARRAGKTLVAPVLAYVPEGDVEPKKTGHMRFAGTLSLTETLFEQVLIETARSLKAHGFTSIYFVGDSGGNQEPQDRVAASLTAEWEGDGVTVANIRNYYAQNGQFAHLQMAGHSDEDIGYHAGMRDTSEVLALKPSGVRLRAGNRIEGMEPGFSGNAAKASAEIGRKMLELKIEAGVRQITKIRASKSGS